MKLSTLIREAQQVLEACGEMDVLVRLPDWRDPEMVQDEWEPESTGYFECPWNKKKFFEIILPRP